jgi:hypothetical protein
MQHCARPFPKVDTRSICAYVGNVARNNFRGSAPSIFVIVCNIAHDYFQRWTHGAFTPMWATMRARISEVDTPSSFPIAGNRAVSPSAGKIAHNVASCVHTLINLVNCLVITFANLCKRLEWLGWTLTVKWRPRLSTFYHLPILEGRKRTTEDVKKLWHWPPSVITPHY